MLHRKLYQLYTSGQEVWIYLRDQQRLIDRARIVDIEGNVVTIHYETDEEDEVCAWEEIVSIESIGSISRRLASVPRGNAELAVSDECPEAEQLPKPKQSSETEHER